MENTTRISELPENIQYQMPAQSQNQNPFPDGNNYMPMNIHPNPYGNTPSSISPPPIQYPQHPPSAPQQNGGYYGGQISPQHPPQQHERLPSKDIRISESEFIQDDAIKANYIPKVQNMRDYLTQYTGEDEDGENERNSAIKHARNKKRVRFADDLFVQLQTPILVVFLFFIFQMAIFNRFLKVLSARFIPLFNEDGNINIYGISLKSVLFGGAFFAITKIQQL